MASHKPIQSCSMLHIRLVFYPTRSHLAESLPSPGSRVPTAKCAARRNMSVHATKLKKKVVEKVKMCYQKKIRPDEGDAKASKSADGGRMRRANERCRERRVRKATKSGTPQSCRAPRFLRSASRDRELPLHGSNSLSRHAHTTSEHAGYFLTSLVSAFVELSLCASSRLAAAREST